MTLLRFLAITPPSAGGMAIDANAPERWMDAGLPPRSLALLLRDPARPALELLQADSPHARVAERARRLGIRTLLSVCPEEYSKLRSIPDGVDGLHLRGKPRPSPGVPPSGRSAHLGDLEDGACLGLACEYWTFAPVFPTREASKTPVGLEALRRACRRLRAPVLALGGIDGSAARDCRDAGAHGIAGISCFFGAAKRVTHDAGAFAGVWHRVLATK